MLVQNGVLMGLVYGLWYIVSLALAMHLMHGGEWSRPFSRVRRNEAIGITVVGVALFGARAILQHLVYENLWIAVFGMLAGIVAIFQVGYLWYYHHDDSDMGWPLILVIAALLAVGQVIWTTTRTWSFLVNNWFWLTVVQALPVLIFIAAVAFVVAEYAFYQFTEYRDEDPSFASERRLFGWVTIILAILAMILFVTGVVPGAQIDWSSLGSSLREDELEWFEPETSQSELNIEWGESAEPMYTVSDWTFYNNYVQSPFNDYSGDDYNFGMSPIQDNVETGWYNQDFRDRIRKDPALGAADIAWFDCVMGTRVLGTFYEECKGIWATTINAAKDKFIADPRLYATVCDKFFSWLDAASVEVRYDGGLTDQMYMDPHTGSNVPDVILMETTEHEGRFLVYRFQVKDNFVEVKYRLECGYQPTNCSEKMNWKPEPVKPTKTSRPRKTPKPEKTPRSKPTPTPGSKPTPTPGSKPTPTPAPKPTKDPTQGTKGDLVGKQDNPGSGESTNNGVGAQTSTKQEEKSSTDGTYKEYKEQVEEKQKVNEEQKKGGDDNKPTVTAAPEVKVDNNSDKGTGNGSVDAPTPKQEKAHEADTGNTISDQPGEAWGGPPD